MEGSERDIHINIVKWFNYAYPEFKDDLHHFANERQCSKIQGYILKKMGVKAGVSDFFLAIPFRGKPGLWLELKTSKGKLSTAQKQFIERKRAMGYEAVVAYGFDEAVNLIQWYLS